MKKHICPVCGSFADAKYGESPYWMCPQCDCWFQDPPPPKVYRFCPLRMSDKDKQHNKCLADWLFSLCLKDRPGRCLDIGSNYPYLSHCFKELGCEAYGMDGIDEGAQYGSELNVPMIKADFEKCNLEELNLGMFDLITLIHSFEHFYQPLIMLQKLRTLLNPNGAIYMRLPDHSCPNFEWELDQEHYMIHPYFHTSSSIIELLRQCGLYTVAKTWSESTVSDWMLVPNRK